MIKPSAVTMLVSAVRSALALGHNSMCPRRVYAEWPCECWYEPLERALADYDRQVAEAPAIED